MKMKEIGLRGGAHPSARWIRQWNNCSKWLQVMFWTTFMGEVSITQFPHPTLVFIRQRT